MDKEGYEIMGLGVIRLEHLKIKSHMSRYDILITLAIVSKQWPGYVHPR